MPQIANHIKETSNTVGLGSFALLGAVPGNRAFSADPDGGIGATYYYTARSRVAGQFEDGIGTLTNGTTLTRTTILSSSSGGAKVDFAAGVKDIYVCTPKKLFDDLNTVNETQNGHLTSLDVAVATLQSDVAQAQSTADGASSTATSAASAAATAQASADNAQSTADAADTDASAAFNAAAAAQATANAALPLAGGTMSGDIDMGGNNLDFAARMTSQSGDTRLVIRPAVDADSVDGFVVEIFGGGASSITAASFLTTTLKVFNAGNGCQVNLTYAGGNNHDIVIPDNDGTLALLSDLSSYLSTGGGQMSSDIDMNSHNVLNIGNAVFVYGPQHYTLHAPAVEGFDVDLTLPSTNGTLALLSDIPGAPDLSGYLPLSGGTMSGGINGGGQTLSNFAIDCANSGGVTGAILMCLYAGSNFAYLAWDGTSTVLDASGGAGELRVNGVRVVGSQQGAIVDADVGDLSSVGTQLNSVLASMRLHGLIAT